MMAAGITGSHVCRFCSGGIHHDEDAIPEDGNCVLGGWVSNATYYVNGGQPTF